MNLRSRSVSIVSAACAALVVFTSVATDVRGEEPGPPAVERPISFDTQERIAAITPPLAARLGLAAPEWPLLSPYREARLYRDAEDRTVLVAEREDGSVERWALSEDEVRTLRDAVDRASAGLGVALPLENADDAGPNAGGAFVRNQTFSALAITGPALAVIANSATASTAAYSLAVGSTFFAATRLSRARPISAAQAHLSWDASWKGAGVGMLLLDAATNNVGDDEERAFAWAAFGGSLAGSVAGYKFGRPLTQGEAHGASFGSTAFGAFAAGVAVASAREAESSRPFSAAVAAGALAGYPLGLRYARRASYSITAGDVGALTAAAAIGVLAAAPFVVREDDPSTIEDEGPDVHTTAAALTAGLVAGTIVGDRWLVRPVDHNSTEGWLLGFGAAAGALLAAAIPSLADDPDSREIVTAGAIGSILGIVATEKMLSPKKASPRR